MLALLIILAVLGVTLTAVLWLGSLFLQSYFFTEPSRSLYWQAPLAAAVMTAFFFFWSLLNLWGASTSGGKTEIPYGILWEFNNRVDVVAEPVPELESKRRTAGKALFKLDKSAPGQIRYKSVDDDDYWSPMGVEYVKFSHNGQDYHFVPDKSLDLAGYVVFVDAEAGLEMREFEIGRAGYSSASRLVVYFLLNLSHLLLWIVCFWLVLRFELSQALGLGAAMWLLFTLAIFPVLFAESAH